MKTQQKKILILLASIFCLIACRDKSEKLTQNSTKTVLEQKNINFDAILKCSNYSYNDNYFLTADYGCIYNPTGQNNLGNIIIYLVPKKSTVIPQENIENKNSWINSLDANKYKNDFEIYIYLIDKQYLNYNNLSDPSYYQKENYKEELYTYNSNSKSWNLIDTINVKDYNKEQEWRENFINNKINTKVSENIEIVNNISNLIKQKEFENFILTKQQLCDLNQDNLKDEILIFKNNKEYSSEDLTTQISPVIILMNTGNGKYKKFENSKIFPNAFQDYYVEIIIKNEIFTIELANEIPDKYVVSKYISFKYERKTEEIILNKYEEILIGEVNESNIYTSKNFGKITFENFDINDFRN